MSKDREMSPPSIGAYDLPTRVATYDKDMEVMHPNRAKMIDVMLEVLPLAPDFSPLLLELGVGTAFLTKRFLDRFPASRVIAIEGAKSMVELARTRLGGAVKQVDFRIGDFRDLGKLISEKERGNVVLSSYSLHHLNSLDKERVIRRSLGFLEPGGWFLNADIIIAETPEMEARFQELRVDGILRRASPSDKRFLNAKTAREFLYEMEKTEKDQPLTLAEDFQTLRNAGLTYPTVFWLEYREAVTGGVKRKASAGAG